MLFLEEMQPLAVTWICMNFSAPSENGYAIWVCFYCFTLIPSDHWEIYLMTDAQSDKLKFRKRPKMKAWTKYLSKLV